MLKKSKLIAKLRGRKKEKESNNANVAANDAVLLSSARKLDNKGMPDARNSSHASLGSNSSDVIDSRTGDGASIIRQLEPDEEQGDASPRPSSLMKSTEIRAEDLLDTFVTKHADEDRLFRAEFESMPAVVQSLQAKCDYAKRPENKEKNRYRNVVTCDESRVKLSKIGDDEFSDYINASYINGYQEEKKFIASQGPKENTIDDFWRMIWEQRCYVIVMITELRELGRFRKFYIPSPYIGQKKCEQYWPTEDATTYDKVTVQSESLIDYGSFTQRLLKVTHSDLPDETPRILSHFHYRAWPDHGAPKTTSEIFRFRARTLEAQPGGDINPGPILVHCSAGVGRTGTYIALDALLNRLREERKVDVYSLIVDMRQKRTEMVQSLDQYVLLHKLVTEYEMYGVTDVMSEDFRESYDQLSKIDAESGKSGFESLFEHLRNTCSTNGRTGSGGLEQNRSKNRDQDVVPYDHSKAFVRMRPAEQYPLYVNASTLQGYDVTRTIVATQAPMENTAEDFWRVVIDDNVSCILMLVPLEVDGEETCYKYFPDSASTRFGEITVHSDVSRDHAFFTETSFSVLSDEKGAIAHSVTHLRYPAWNDPDVLPPEGGAALLSLVDFVAEKLQRVEGKPRLLVHCSDGAGRTGIFCSTFNLAERLAREQRVDVFRSVKDLRDYRPLMVRTAAQFKICYDVILARIEPMDEKPESVASSDQDNSLVPGNYENSFLVPSNDGYEELNAESDSVPQPASSRSSSIELKEDSALKPLPDPVAESASVAGEWAEPSSNEDESVQSSSKEDVAVGASTELEQTASDPDLPNNPEVNSAEQEAEVPVWV